MTTEQIKTEQKRIDLLTTILLNVSYAKRKIKTQKENYKYLSSFAGQGEKIDHNIYILKESIKRLNNRYFKVLNG